MTSFPGPTSHSFMSQRLRLHYVDWGNRDAPPLILQHGGRDHCRSWDWVADSLRKDWHVICPDLRGHGDSAWSPDADYTSFAYAYDFAQLIETLGYDEVTIIGHSLGGFVSSIFAGLYPERVRRFVNIEGMGLPPQIVARLDATPYPARMREWIDMRRKSAGRLPRRYPTIEAAFARMKAENAYLTDAQARHLTVHGISRNEDGSWSWKFDNYLNAIPVAEIPRNEIHGLLRAITCEVLLFYGKDSWASNPAVDGRIKLLQHARLIEYENAGHWLHHDQTERFLADIAAFL